MTARSIKQYAAAIIATSACAMGLAAPATVKVALLEANEPQCAKELAKYAETMRFLRQTAGDQIASRVANGYVGEAELARTVSMAGACAGAQLLRDKKALR